MSWRGGREGEREGRLENLFTIQNDCYRIKSKSTEHQKCWWKLRSRREGETSPLSSSGGPRGEEELGSKEEVSNSDAGSHRTATQGAAREERKVSEETSQDQEKREGEW